MIVIMERPRTQDEVRKEAFDEVARRAKALGDKALHDLDAVLAEDERVWEQMASWAGCDVVGKDELLAAMWSHRQNPERHSSPNFYA